MPDPVRPKSRSEPPRVLVVTEYGILNGGERSFLAIAGYLDKQGWDLTVAVPRHTEFESSLNDLGLVTVPFETADSQGKPLSQTLKRDRLKRLIREQQPSLVHCNSLSTSRLCGPLVHELGIPGLGHLRDIMKLSRQAIADINQLETIIAVSQVTRDWHIAQGIDARKIQVIYNGVDLEHFSPTMNSPEASIRNELGIPADCPLLLFVGQLGMRKGVDILIEAFVQIADSRSDCHLIIVGQRHSGKSEAIEFENRLHHIADQSCSADRIHWLGRCHDVARLMRQATVLLHPARQEPLGRVLLEAAATGLPLITTRIGGSPEILSNFDGSNLLQPAESQAFAIRCLELLENESERKLISKRLRKIALTRFSDRQCARQISKAYSQIVRSPS